MMREIKFRAWDKIRKTMNYQKSDHPTFGNHCFDFGDLFYYAKNNLIAMQYTGLKDKKRTAEYPEGQEIYEGDILKSEYGYSVIVVWNEKYTGFEGKLICDKEHSCENLPYALNHGEAFEVIGNIYENPELLQQPSAKHSQKPQ